MMRSIFGTAVLILGFSCAVADESQDIVDFNEAYSAYLEHYQKGDFAQALPAAKHAYEFGLKIFDDKNEGVPTLAYNYGLALQKSGNREDARRVLKEAVPLYERVYGKKSEKLIPVLVRLGDLSVKALDSRPQKKYYDRALRISSEHFGKTSDKHGGLLLKAGVGILNGAETRDASSYLEDAYEILSATRGDDDRLTGTAAFHLGRYLFARRKFKDSTDYLLAALRTFEDAERPSSPVEMSVHAWLVTAYEKQGESEKATEHCLAIGRMTPATEDQDHQPLFRQAPRYPSIALSEGNEGHVVVEFTVDSQGFVRDAEAVDVVGDASFVRSAVNAASDFRYAPRFENGKPVDTENVHTKISFRIAD